MPHIISALFSIVQSDGLRGRPSVVIRTTSLQLVISGGETSGAHFLGRTNGLPVGSIYFCYARPGDGQQVVKLWPLYCDKPKVQL